MSIWCRAGLILFFVVCSFACVAVGRGVATELEVITKFQDSGGANGAVGVEARVTVDAAGGDTSTLRSKHTEVSKLQVPAHLQFLEPPHETREQTSKALIPGSERVI